MKEKFSEKLYLAALLGNINAKYRHIKSGRGITNSYEDTQTEFFFLIGCFFKNGVIRHIFKVNLCNTPWVIIFYYYPDYS